jgi:cobaltochelatase CobN
MVFQAYLEDDTVRDFLERENPDALHDIATRLLEAQDRGLWQPRRNTTREMLEQLGR